MMSFIKNGYNDALKGKTFDPYAEEMIGRNPDGSFIVKKTFDPIYADDFQRGRKAKFFKEVMEITGKRCPHCGKAP